MGSSNFIKGIILTCLSAVLFGLNPYFVILLRSSGMGILPPLVLRFLGGMVIYFVLILFSKGMAVLKIPKKSIPLLIAAALFFVLTGWLLIYSYALIPSGLATVLHFSYPLLITLFSIKAGRDKFSLVLFICLLFAVLGIVLVSSPDCGDVSFYGIFIAILSAFTFASYLFVLNSNELKKLDNNVFVFYLSLFSIAFLVIVVIFNLLVNGYTPISYDIDYRVMIGAVGFVFACAFGVSFFSLGARIVGGPIAGTLSSFEPLTAVIIGILVLNEPSPHLFIYGVVLIMASTLILSLSSFKKNIQE